MAEKEIHTSETKEKFYALLTAQLEALLSGETDWLANLANTAALMYDQLPQINWAGFYLEKDKQLVLGPFQGKPACVRIDFGHGVCGTGFEKNQTQIVEDVHAFPGHIACDAASLSEIVIPFYNRAGLSGVLDIDSPVKARFDDVDHQGLQGCLAVLWRSLE